LEGGGATWPSAEALSTPMATYQVFDAVYLRFSFSRDTALRHWMILLPTFRHRLVTPKHWANDAAQLPGRTKTSRLKVSKKAAPKKKSLCYVNSQIFRGVKNCERRPLASTLSVSPSVRPSVRMEQLGSHWTDFHEIFYTSYFSKICRKISSFIKIWQNRRYFTWRLTYVHLWYVAQFLEWEILRTIAVEKTKTRHFMFNKFFQKIVPIVT
jgi:hypothetical protein